MSQQPSPKRRRICLSSPRLARELMGFNSPSILSPPARTSSDLPRLQIAELDPTLQLRGFIILGESPVYPHHIVTIPQPLSLELPFTTAPPSPPSIVYWSLNPTHSPPLQISYTIEYPLSPTATLPNSVSTAITTTSPSTFYQVRFHDDSITLISGPQILHVPIPYTDSSPSTCFSDLSPLSCSTLKILHGTQLLLYSPNDPPSNTTPAKSRVWSTPSNVSISYIPGTPIQDRHLPSLRSANLTSIVTTFLLRSPAFTNLLAGRTPRFITSTIATTFLPTKHPLRTKPGVKRMNPHGRSFIAFGGMEENTRLFQVVILATQWPEWGFMVTAARSLRFAVEDEEVEMGLVGAEALLKRGLEVVLKREVEVGHECGKHCFREGREGGGVEVLEEWRGERRSLGEMVLTERGVVVVGWNGDDGGDV